MGDWQMASFGTLVALSVVDEAAFAALEVIGPELLAVHGVSIAQLVITMPAAWLVGVAVGLTGFGPAGDRFDRVMLVQLTALVFAVGTVLVANGQNWLLLFGGLALMGLGSAGVKSVHVALLADRYPRPMRGRVLIGRALLSSAGRGVIPLVLLVLLGTVTSRALFLCLGGIASALGFFALAVRDRKRGWWERWELLAKTRPLDQPVLVEPDHVSRRLGSIATVRAVVGASAGAGFVLYALPAHRATYVLKTFEADLDYRIWNATVTYAPAILFGLAVGRWFDRVFPANPRRVLMLAGWLVVLASPLLPLQFLTTNRIWFLTLGVVSQLLLGAVVAVLVPTVQAIVPSDFRSQGAARPILFSVLVGGLGGLVVAIPLVEEFGTSTAVLILAPPTLLVSGFYLFRASRHVQGDLDKVARRLVLESVAAEGRLPHHPTGPVIEVENVHFSYGHMKVLDGVDFRIAPGETLALLGSNGAGKSTVLRIIAGLETPQQGDVRLEGQVVTFTSPRKRSDLGVQLMVGGNGVFSSMSVRSNLELAVRRYRSNGRDLVERLNYVYGMFPVLKDRGSAIASALSGGERQMLALAMALVHRPNVLIIDELSLGLAPEQVERLVCAVEELKKLGTTIIIVEQSVDTACRVAQRSIFMEKGRVAFDGESRALQKERPDLLQPRFLRDHRELAEPRLDLTRESPVIDIRPLMDRSETTEPVLRTADLRVTFDKRDVVFDAAIVVGQHERVAIVGGNGAGKSTLMNAIGGYVRSTGKVYLHGRDVSRARPADRARHGLGRSFQSAKLFPELTVQESVLVAHEARGATHLVPTLAFLPGHAAAERRRRQQCSEIMDFVGLGDYADHQINELSTGTRRLVQLACVMAMGASVLCLDEPTAGVAQAEVERFGSTLERVRHKLEASLLLVEHNISFMRACTDRMYFMEGGMIIAEGPTDELLSHPSVRRRYGSAGADAPVMAANPTG